MTPEKARRDMVSLAGWLFADLLLGFAVLFLVADTRSLPVQPTVTPASSPVPTTTQRSTRHVTAVRSATATATGTPTRIPVLPTYTPLPTHTPRPTYTPWPTCPPVTISRDPIDVAVETNLSAILRGSERNRAQQLEAVRRQLEPNIRPLIAEDTRAGMVLTFGNTTTSRPGDGVLLASTINSLLRDEWPRVFGDAAFQDFLSFKEEPGLVRIQIFTLSGGE